MNKEEEKTQKGNNSKHKDFSPPHEKLPYETPKIINEEQFEIYSMNCAFGGGCTTQGVPNS